VGGSGTTGDGALFASGGNASAAGIRITGGSGGKGINVDTLTMSGAAVITGGLTTNITGTITTATNLTNAPTNGDFTAVMKTSLNTATPTVTVPAADIRNAIGMASANLDTQLTGINTNTTNATSPLATAASIAALENISSTDVENAVDKVINTNAHAELTSIPAANAPLGAKIELNAMAARNGGKATASSVEINKDNGVALGTATLTKTSTSFTRGKLA
jgi:nanoRNase/pAp phosphatase (c-di-AMP/oligoRNAs hydrolase)